MRSTRWGAGLLVAATLTTLPASYAATRSAVTHRPTVGECRTLTFRQTRHATNSTAPVACTAPHDDRVIKVAGLPTDTSWADLTPTQVTRLSVTECTPAYRRALGQSDRVRDSSAYAWVFFEPTADQIAGGASWIRCDLVLLQGDALRNLPTDTAPALASGTLPARVRRCLTGGHHVTTVCAAAHDFRATGGFTVAGRYRGDRALATIARRRCPAHVTTPRRFLFAHQQKLTWNREHDHAVICFSHRST